MSVTKVEYSPSYGTVFYTYLDGGIVGFIVKDEAEIMERLDRHQRWGITSDVFITTTPEEYKKLKSERKDWKVMYGKPQLRLVK